MNSSTLIQTIVQYSGSILPWVVIGIGLAYFLEKHITPHTVKRYLGTFGNGRMLTAIFLGMVSPLSIMSFLPVAREFIDLGAHPAVLFGFLIAERAYDLQSFFIITRLFGIKFAILNAFAIFISLYLSIVALEHERINFTINDGKRHNHFWYRQVKILGVVGIGIVVSALFRSVIPQNHFENMMGDTVGGITGALLSGSILYLGPIIANYPIAKAFADLGMSQVGVFAFLTVSPVINIVIISLFGGTVGYRTTLKSFCIYGMAALICTLLATFML